MPFMIALGLLLSCSFASAAPINIAVFDSVLDTEHPAVKSYLNSRAMQNSQVLYIGGKRQSLASVNAATYKVLREKFGYIESEVVEEQAQVSKKLGQPLTFEDLAIQISKYSMAYHRLPELLHGTHMASIACDGLRKTQMIYVPFFSGFAPRESATAEEIRSVFKAYFDDLTVILKKHKVRVVNLSMGTNEPNFLRRLVFLVFPKRGKLTDLVLETVASEFGRFLDENPETIFVIAAGNDGKSIRPGALGYNNHQESHVVVVGSLMAPDRLSAFSSRSDQFVKIAAPGERIIGALAGTDWVVRGSGTSQATAIVTNRLARILENDPELSPSEALQILYTDHVYEIKRLNSDIERGRTLRDLSNVPPQQLKVRPGLRGYWQVLRQCYDVFKSLPNK